MTLGHTVSAPGRWDVTSPLFLAWFDSFMIPTMTLVVTAIVMIEGVVDASATEQASNVQVLH
jgi:hypothetical protein